MAVFSSGVLESIFFNWQNYGHDSRNQARTRAILSLQNNVFFKFMPKASILLLLVTKSLYLVIQNLSGKFMLITIGFGYARHKFNLSSYLEHQRKNQPITTMFGYARHKFTISSCLEHQRKNRHTWIDQSFVLAVLSISYERSL